MMKRQQNSVEGSLHKAFELLIRIKGHRQANQLLNLANSYLGMLLNTEAGAEPVVVSVCTVRIRQP